MSHATTNAPALERITTSHLLSALNGVSMGRTFDLGTDMGGVGMPHGSAEVFSPFRVTPYRTPVSLRDDADPPAFDFSMEVIQGSPHLGSHIDGLAHVQSRGMCFGGHHAREIYSDFGWEANGMETVSPIIGRGVLLDVAGALGVEMLEDEFEIQPDHVKQTCATQGTSVRDGDVVLVRTGKFRQYAHDGEAYFASQPGVGPDAAIWLYDRGMAVMGTDTSGTEPLPFTDPNRTTHQVMIVERGVMLLEILDLEELAAERIYEFLFVCLPLRIVGATGSWVRPVALV